MKRKDMLVSGSLVMAVVYAFSGCSNTVSTENSSVETVGSAEESIVEMSASEETEINIFPTETIYRDIAVNDLITFGSYPQEKDGTVKPIEWIVLDVQDGQALLLSKYGLDCQPYEWDCGDYDTTNWEDCSVRAWLNDEFLYTAFSDDEQSLIIETTLRTQSSSDGKEHVETDDMVFLLSQNDAYKYFDDDYSRICYVTDYIFDDINWFDKMCADNRGESYEVHKDCVWWLRTPGGQMNFAMSISSSGKINTFGYGVSEGAYIVHSDGTEEYYEYTSEVAVRPAIWVDASAFPVSQTIYSDEQLSDKSSVVINEENFPDEVFRELVAEKYDTDGNGILVIQEIMSITDMGFLEKNIYDLKGLEYFRYLENIDISKNHLSGTIDFSSLNNLVSLTLLNNKESETLNLVFKNNQRLETVNCSGSNVTSIDLVGCVNLIYLSCSNNSLTDLDLHELINLENLYCSGNNLNELDVSFNTKLKNLYCSNNTINGIDLKNNEDIEVLRLGASISNDSDTDNSERKSNLIGDLDLSHCKNLRELNVCDCNLNSLNISGCTKIKTLDISYNPEIYNKMQWTSLDNMTSFRCSNTGITALDLSKYPALKYLYCSHNKLTKLDISTTGIETLDCSYNQLTTLELNGKIGELDCSENCLTSLDLSGLPYIWAYCYHNNIDYIDVTGLPLLPEDIERWNNTHEGPSENEYGCDIRQAGPDYFEISHPTIATGIVIDENVTLIY